MYVMITWLLLLVSLVTQGTQQKARTDWKTDSQMDWLYFTENLFSTIVDLFCRYKSDDNMNIVYTDH